MFISQIGCLQGTAPVRFPPVRRPAYSSGAAQTTVTSTVSVLATSSLPIQGGAQLWFGYCRPSSPPHSAPRSPGRPRRAPDLACDPARSASSLSLPFWPPSSAAFGAANAGTATHRRWFLTCMAGITLGSATFGSSVFHGETLVEEIAGAPTKNVLSFLTMRPAGSQISAGARPRSRLGRRRRATAGAL